MKPTKTDLEQALKAALREVDQVRQEAETLRCWNDAQAEREELQANMYVRNLLFAVISNNIAWVAGLVILTIVD